jgi:hypothetical protein
MEVSTGCASAELRIHGDGTVDSEPVDSHVVGWRLLWIVEIGAHPVGAALNTH